MVEIRHVFTSFLFSQHIRLRDFVSHHDVCVSSTAFRETLHEHFDRHRPVEAGVPSFVDLALYACRSVSAAKACVPELRAIGATYLLTG